MEIDETDLLATNSFIQKPLLDDISNELNSRFREYYERELKKEDESRIRNIVSAGSVPEGDDIVHINKAKLGGKRRLIERKTIVSIDSRDRNKAIYSKPNYFKIFLGRSFYNVKSVALVSLEFPNTDAVINSSNNGVYWRNLEDIEDDILDDITGEYPVYSTKLRIGSYTLPTIETEMSNKLLTVKRKNGIDEFHYFIVDLDFETDISTVTSLYLQQLQNEPITSISGSGLLKVKTPQPHNLSTGDTVYMIGAKTFAGLPTASINGEHTITVVSLTEFTYEININAISAGEGGGNTCKIGTLAPYQLLFGDYTDTIANNLGFPIENSAERIDTPFSSIRRKFQVKITTLSPHLLSRDFTTIGKILSVNNASGLSGNFVISDIPDSTSLLLTVPQNDPLYNYTSFIVTRISNQLGQVKITLATSHGFIPGDNVTLFNTNSTPQINGVFTVIDVTSTELILDSSIEITQIGSFGYLSNGYFTLEGNNYPILSSINWVEQIEVTTQIGHNYDHTDIGNSITLFGTTTTPVLDGEVELLAIPTTTSFVIGGTILANKTITGTEIDVGRTPRHNVLKTFTFRIISAVIIGNYIRITTDVPHTLRLGDSIQLRGLQSVPDLNNVTFLIVNIPTSNTLEIAINVTSISVTDESILQTGLVEVSFYNHQFNEIVSIQRIGVTIEIITKLEHGLNTGDKVRISKSNSTPSIDSPLVSGGAYTITKVNNYTFTFPMPLSLVGLPWTAGSYGVLGMNNEFNIYGADELGGLQSTVINKRHQIREVLDNNTFTIYIQNVFATSNARGGGTVFISSLRHGFNGTQTNTKNGLLYRSINLEGENYCFLTCPTLATVMNTGNVRDIFARISLTESPGGMIFNEFNSSPKIFEESPLPILNELEFSVKNYNDTLYEFNDLDYSFALEITEIIEQLEESNISSRTLPPQNGYQPDLN